MHEVLRQLEPAIDRAEHGICPDPHVGQRDLCVVGRHVECSPEKLDLEAGGVGRDKKGADPPRVAWLASGTGEDDVVGRMMKPAVPALHTVENPLVAVANCSGPDTSRRFRDSAR